MAKKEKKLKANPLTPEAPATAGPEREGCLKCGLFRNCTTPFMAAQVPKNWTGRLLLVGEAPGADEDQESGHPFSGRSGKLLRGWLQEAGFTEQDVAFTNANRCRPLDNETPNMVQVRACRPFLEWEIQTLKPQNILGVGTTAARSLTNDGQAVVTRLRGRPLTLPKEDHLDS